MRHVCMNGKGVDLNIDHHTKAPYSHLYTNIDAGEGTRIFNGSGPSGNGGNAGGVYNLLEYKIKAKTSLAHKW